MHRIWGLMAVMAGPARLVQVGHQLTSGPLQARGSRANQGWGMSGLDSTVSNIESSGVRPNPLSTWGRTWVLLSEVVSDDQRELISRSGASSQGPLNYSEGKAKPTQDSPSRLSPSRRP